jgi:hypothetical protein
MACEQPAYTYLAKGKYWYFRKDGWQERLPGAPGDADFTDRYHTLIERGQLKRARQSARAIGARNRRLSSKGGMRAGTIYFIGAKAGAVKIGFTTDLDARLHRLQMNCPTKLVVLACHEGLRRDELELHRRFASARLHGEWFRRTTDVVEAIRDAEQDSLHRRKSMPIGHPERKQATANNRASDCELFSRVS